MSNENLLETLAMTQLVHLKSLGLEKVGDYDDYVKLFCKVGYWEF